MFYNTYEEIYNLVNLGYSLVSYTYSEKYSKWLTKLSIKDENGKKVPPIKSGRGILYIENNTLMCDGKEEIITPEYGYWVLLGRNPKLLVLDFDLREGGDSLNDLLGEVKENLGWLNKSSYVRTPSGGIHMYFKIPDFSHPKYNLYDGYYSIKSRAPEPLICKQHVDVRVGYNSGIPLPGIIKKGVPYQWEYGYLTDAIEMPIHVASKLCCEPKFVNPENMISDNSKPITSDTVEKYLNNIRLAAEGSRQGTLNANAYYLGQYIAAGKVNISNNDVYSQLINAGLQTGLSLDEVETTVKNALNSSK